MGPLILPRALQTKPLQLALSARESGFVGVARHVVRSAGIGLLVLLSACASDATPDRAAATPDAAVRASDSARATALPKSANRQAGDRRLRLVDKSRLHFDDGDTVDIAWDDARESVRILGIDTPEVAHPEHKLPISQPWGERAAGFLEGCLARSTRVEVLDRGQKDPYGRTLGYLLLDQQNYSVLVLEAGLAAESVTHYGDNGFPEEAAACLAAAKRAGPLPFEAPHEWRKRFRLFVEHQTEQSKLR